MINLRSNIQVSVNPLYQSVGDTMMWSLTPTSVILLSTFSV